jgi:hypothetical protein
VRRARYCSADMPPIRRNGHKDSGINILETTCKLSSPSDSWPSRPSVSRSNQKSEEVQTHLIARTRSQDRCYRPGRGRSLRSEGVASILAQCVGSCPFVASSMSTIATSESDESYHPAGPWRIGSRVLSPPFAATRRASAYTSTP